MHCFPTFHMCCKTTMTMYCLHDSLSMKELLSCCSMIWNIHLSAMAEDMSNYYLPKTQTFVELDCTEAFNNLTDQEKLYAHYLTQVRYLFIYLHHLFSLYTSPGSSTKLTASISQPLPLFQIIFIIST